MKVVGPLCFIMSVEKGCLCVSVNHGYVSPGVHNLSSLLHPLSVTLA